MWEFLSQLAGSEIAKSLGGGMDDWKSLWEKMQNDPSFISGNTTEEGVPTMSAANQLAGMMARANSPIYRPGVTPNLGFGGMFR